MDQSLFALSECYGYGGEPERIDTGEYQELTLDRQMLMFGEQARQKIYLPNVARTLRAAHGEQLKLPEAAVEFIWFMFSQKNWRVLEGSIRHHAGLGSLPDHIVDLYFLSRFRLCKEMLFKGTDHRSFECEMRDALELIVASWPDLIERHHLYFAIFANSIGQWDEARATIAAVGPKLNLIPALSGARSTLAKSFAHASLQWLVDIHPAKADAASLVSVDENYFWRYGADFVKAHTISNPGRAVHFHCVGFDPRTIATDILENPLIGFTVDNTDLTGFDRINRTGYYAGARFIHAHLYLAHYNNLQVSDVDGILQRSVNEVLADRDDADVVLQTTIMQPPRSIYNMPWAAIPAGVVIMRNTKGGRRFADYLCRYLSTIFEAAKSRERPLWFADQCALYYAFVDLRREIQFRPAGKPIYTQGGDWTLFHGDDGKKSHLSRALQQPQSLR